MKSALRGIRHIQAFPTIADPERQSEKKTPKTKRIIAAREGRKRGEWLAQHARLAPELRPYFLGYQHDSFIQSFMRNGDRFTVTAFDRPLEEALGVWDNLLPFEVVFEGVSYVGWRTERQDGELIPASAPKGETEWLDDAFVDVETPGVRWILSLWPDEPIGGWCSGRFLLVEAREMRVVELQREAWLARLGAGEIGVFDRYLATRMESPLNHPLCDERIRRLVE